MIYYDVTKVSDELHLRLVDELPQCVHRPHHMI